MIVGNENIFAWMRLNANPYWTLRDNKGDRGRPIAESEKTPSLGLEESISRLRQVFSMKGNRGQYYIITRPTQDFNSTANLYQDNIELTEVSNHQQPAIMGMPVQGNFLTKEDLLEELKKARADWEKEQQIRELQEEIKELKKGAKLTNMDAFIGRIEPYVPHILGAMFKQKTPPAQNQTRVGVAGFPPQTNLNNQRNMTAEQEELEGVEEMEDNNSRIQKALERLDEILSPEGINIIDVLEKLADKAEQNPTQIKSAIQMIM